MSSKNQRISPLTIKYTCPQLFLLLTCVVWTNTWINTYIPNIPCFCIHSKNLHGTHWFPQSRRTSNNTTQSSALQHFTYTQGGGTSPADRPPSPCTNPTTSVLTAATLIYAFGAGITAAAGTRLALQLLVTHSIRVSSFQSQNMYASHCYVLSLPPCIEIGKVARLLPSLDVVAMPKAPSPESNPNSPLPVNAAIRQYHTNNSW